MTKREFAAGFVASAPLHQGTQRVEKDEALALYERLTVPCDCGRQECEGWRMISPILVGYEVGANELSPR